MRPRSAALACLVAATAALAACGPPEPEAPTTPEGRLRARLGIPPDARRVIVFQQSAHLDVDWQRTFDGYYGAFVERILLDARDLLARQPRASYAITELAYLARHLDAHPGERAALAAAARSGALRVVGGGLTSPDTLLPETELLLRDLLLGARFAEELGAAPPRAAYLPDSFGHSGALPDLLVAAGFESVAFARVDGARDFYERLVHLDAPRPGSTAERLAALASDDFRWRGPGGGEVIAHFLSSPGLYCAGDNIDYQEQLQLPGSHVGVYQGDDPGFTDAQIDRYVAERAPRAKTPYLFVPIGCDFQRPKPELLRYLDGYDQRRYPSTGVWAVAAPFDDYAALVAAHREALPSLEADLTPYYMGVYGSRPELKRRVREAARPLLSAEPFAVAAGEAGRAAITAAAPSLELLVRSNHHDFVTGTSTDAVVAGEQLPLLDGTEAAGRVALDAVTRALAARIPRTPGAAARVVAFNPSATARSEVVTVDVPLAPPGHLRAATAAGDPVAVEAIGGATTVRLALADLPPLGWRAVDLLTDAGVPPPPAVTVDLLDAGGHAATGDAVAEAVLASPRVRATFRRAVAAAPFVLASLRIDGAELIAAPSFLVATYDDMGGLWRLGNEMTGCALTPRPPTVGAPEMVEVLERTALTARLRFTAGDATREARLDATSSGLDLALVAAAPPGTTRTATFALAVPAGAPLETSAPGGFLARTVERVYRPTFWPAVEWARVGPAALLLRQSTGVRFLDGGGLEVMAVRDARGEQCDALGGSGTDPGAHRIEWRIERVAGAAEAARRASAWNRPVVTTASAGGGGGGGDGRDLAAERSLVRVEGEGAVSALTPARRGDGAILRVLLLPGPVTMHLGPPLAGRRATRTDALERDLDEVATTGDALVLDAARFGRVATVRLH